MKFIACRRVHHLFRNHVSAAIVLIHLSIDWSKTNMIDECVHGFFVFIGESFEEKTIQDESSKIMFSRHQFNGTIHKGR